MHGTDARRKTLDAVHVFAALHGIARVLCTLPFNLLLHACGKGVQLARTDFLRRIERLVLRVPRHPRRVLLSAAERRERQGKP